jgi:hypothetical protein
VNENPCGLVFNGVLRLKDDRSLCNGVVVTGAAKKEGEEQ